MVLLPAQGMDVAAIAGREGFIVEQLVDEFTWSKPLDDSRSVRQPLLPQPVHDEQLGRGRVSHAGTLLA